MSTLLCVRLSDASLCPLPKRYGLLQFTQCLGEEFVASNEKMSLENLVKEKRYANTVLQSVASLFSSLRRGEAANDREKEQAVEECKQKNK